MTPISAVRFRRWVCESPNTHRSWQISLDSISRLGHTSLMPPVNRRNPVRAKSSESQFSLMEFMKEYPNDEACLVTLWRKRFAADGVHAHCPKCQQEREFARYDTTAKKPAW